MERGHWAQMEGPLQRANTAEIPWVARKFRKASARHGTATFGKWADLGIVALVTSSIPYIAALALPLVDPLAARIDSPRYWFLQTTHQLAVLMLALLAMRAVSTRSWADWGFNLRNAGTSLKMAAAFAVPATIVAYFLGEPVPSSTPPLAPWAAFWILGTHLLIIGTTQEVLFRAFVMRTLEQRWPTAVHLGKVAIPVSGMLAAVIFTLAHVKLFPPSVWPVQIAASFVYGIVYAIVFQRTGSLLGVSLLHGYTNTVFVAIVMLKSA